MKTGVPCMDGLRRTQGFGQSKTIALGGAALQHRYTRPGNVCNGRDRESNWPGGQWTRSLSEARETREAELQRQRESESDPQGQRGRPIEGWVCAQYLTKARGKSFNQGFVYLRARLGVAASCTSYARTKEPGCAGRERLKALAQSTATGLWPRRRCPCLQQPGIHYKVWRVKKAGIMAVPG